MAMTSSIPGLSSKAAWSVTFFAFLALAWLGLTGQGVRWPDPMAALAGESKPEIVTEEALDEALQDLEAQLASLEDDGVVGPAAGAPALEQDLERARRTAARAAAGLAPPREELLDQVLAALGTLALDDGSLAGDGAAGGAAAAAKALAAGALADALDRIPPVEENCRMGTPQKCRLRGLDSFFQKLEMVSMGQKARIAAYGDSLIMGDQVVGALRRGLQEQFGNGGPGFFLPAKTAPWYAISGAVVYGDDAWEIRRVTEPTIPDGLYGYGAQAFLARRAGVVSRVECDSRCPWDDITQYEVYYLSQEGGGPFTVKAGGEAPLEVATAGARATSNWFSVKTRPGDLDLRITTGPGSVRLFGVVAENDAKGVVLDSLGILGATEEAMSRLDPGHLAEQVGHRSPDLILLVFGTNTSEAASLDLAAYKTRYKRLVEAMRKGKPDVSILLISPPARGTRGRQGIALRPNIEALARVQAEVARETGAAFWSAFDAMGGAGGPQAWFEHDPKLLGDDLTHFTRQGAITMGKMIQASLLRAFMEYRKR